MLKKMFSLIAASAFATTANAQLTKVGEPVSINWYHGADVLRPVIAEYMRETGRKVIVTDDYDGYTTDVVMVSDYKSLTEGKKARRLQKLVSAKIDAAVPARWRDRDGYWTGVVLRTRAPIYNRNLVPAQDVPRTWFDLADPKWRGKITLRVASNVYNRTLVAWMIHHYGVVKARAWVRGVLANAGPTPEFNGDTANVGLVGRGSFPLSFVNTYYMGYVATGAMTGQATSAELQNVGIAWMDKTAPGQPVNVTGAGINRATENIEHARLLIEWLVSKRGQSLLSQHTFKYPVRPDVQPSAYLRTYGRFRPDLMDLNKLEYRYDQADQILRESGWSADW